MVSQCDRVVGMVNSGVRLPSFHILRSLLVIYFIKIWSTDYLSSGRLNNSVCLIGLLKKFL